MSNNAENEGGSIHGDNNASNKGGSIYGDNNSSNEGGSIGKRHRHEHDHEDGGDERVATPAPDPTPGDPVGGFAETLPTDGVTLAFPVTHNLDTRDTLEQVYNPVTGLQYFPGIVAGNYSVIHTSDNVTTFVFVAPAPLPGTVRVVIAGVYGEGS